MTVRLAILIPAFNESARLEAMLTSLLTHVSKKDSVNLVVVDDGSSQPIRIDLTPPVNQARIHLLRHEINLGQGAALQTALEFARDRLKCDFFVTMDADGQHDPRDLDALLAPIRLDQADIVFGNRFQAESAHEIPALRKLILRAASHFERALTGLQLGDAHNGFRAINRRAAEHIQLRQNRMAHATEIKQQISRHRLRYAEVPVRIHYSQETLAKGQSSWGGAAILLDLFKMYLFERII